MEKTDDPDLPPGMPQQHRVLLELIYAVKTLASTTERMHRDLKEVLEEEGKARDKELDKIKEIVSKNAQLLHVMPIMTADRLDRLIDKKVDGVLEDVRLSLNEVREKLYYYVKQKEALASVPTKEVDPNDDITGRFEVGKDHVRLSFKTDGIGKFWKTARWIAEAIAAGGGGWAIIKSLFLDK